MLYTSFMDEAGCIEKKVWLGFLALWKLEALGVWRAKHSCSLEDAAVFDFDVAILEPNQTGLESRV